MLNTDPKIDLSKLDTSGTDLSQEDLGKLDLDNITWTERQVMLRAEAIERWKAGAEHIPTNEEMDSLVERLGLAGHHEPSAREWNDMLLQAKRENKARETADQELEPLYKIGIAKGYFRERGMLLSPSRGQTIMQDSHAKSQNSCIMGDTGSGKSLFVLMPLAKRDLQNPKLGMYVTDAKADIWKDISKMAIKVGREHDIRVIGTGSYRDSAGRLIQMFGIDVLENLPPSLVILMLKTVLAQSGKGAGSDAMWQDMALLTFERCLVLADAWIRTDEGRAEYKRTRINPYSYWWCFRTVTNNDKLIEVINAVNSYFLDKTKFERVGYRINSVEVQVCLDYFIRDWLPMAWQTQSGIKVNIIHIFGGLTGNKVLRERFGCGNPANHVSVAEALNSKLVMNALSISDGGMAKTFSVQIKTRLYYDARERQKRIGNLACLKTPCTMIIDELHLMASLDTSGSGLDDLGMATITRSTGLAMHVTFQGLVSLGAMVGGEANARSLVLQFDNKYILKTRDRDVIDLANGIIGDVMQSDVYEVGHRGSIEHCTAMDNWSPLGRPLDAFEFATDITDFDYDNLDDIALDRSFTVRSKNNTIYPFDDRDMPEMTTWSTSTSGLNVSSTISDNTSAVRAARKAERARNDDQTREYLKSGNDRIPLVTAEALHNMGGIGTALYIGSRAKLTVVDFIDLIPEA
jgi:hypothetical protein